ncbi:MAG TPA: hypothetical protein VEZ90_19635 [Blastocatellia bacterium]|nr:hypothetical protein [Blastocatellia bacterium]
MNMRLIFRLVICVLSLSTAVALVKTWAYAGGPLFLVNNKPVTWPQDPSMLPVQGGPQNLPTVDAQGNVLYRVDAGPLGPLSNQQATAIVDHIFHQYSSIPTSTLRLKNAGSIVDPITGQSGVDVTASNFGEFVSNTPTFNNPIIFDSKGDIIGDDLILGEFGPIAITPAGFQDEGFVALNGQSLTKNIIGTTSFIGVFQHEFGHFAAVLDHEQINGIVGDGVLQEAGFTSGQAFDLFAPFTETLYPFVYPAPSDSQLGAQFPDSGFFIATLDMDSANAVSNLYPTPSYLSSFGSIEGTVSVPAGDANLPLQGINVIARQMPDGAVYPPPPGTLAYPSPPTLDSFGIPAAPPFQTATAPLSIVSSAVTGEQFGLGTYKISGLPPGNYLVQLQTIDPQALGGSSIGQLVAGGAARRQVILPTLEEFYNGSTDSNSPSTFTKVAVTAGQNTSGIDFFVNGLSQTLTPVTQTPGNISKPSAQLVSVPSEITGSITVNDPGKLKVNL